MWITLYTEKVEMRKNVKEKILLFEKEYVIIKTL